ncbi:dihydrolipoamide acetyltransferase family protein [Lederbergia galactosidilytica]|uniref:Dihydrolipoamide acetyltransferase component of pyruvate dehydrogenase complex n=1 Tax=Lederbergia galactosidilytica TaxID=217031 RepID=A0A178A8A4_9BACI|nr:dihydrolipoamide acetyltransferase family protein [Lederbergia galactosidilytica]KRG08708.1 branched-chain alpha-keto acid dehydrogenase subunit E2 [Virgibacillus soli]OAK75298.1 branched-chain alpha-keto acid dehydrogenase subunit E2 [Lederbergia galactosidilytica]
MATENITMPKLGESVTEGTISRWLVEPGDHVEKYDPIAEVMTDKVNAEIPSSFKGVITELIAEEGITLEVGKNICTIEVENKDNAQNQQETTAKIGAKREENVHMRNQNDEAQKLRFSPAVLKLSQEHQIDLSQVVGTGKSGRITRKDVLKFIESGETSIVDEKASQIKEREVQSTPTQPQSHPLVAPKQKIQTGWGDIEIPISNVRKAIATKMVRSKAEIPHAWMMIEVDVTKLVQYRDSLKEEFKQKEGFNLTYFAFFIKAVAQALKEYPMINSMWAGDKIIQKKDINISIAVASGDELFVPVIKHADEKSIKGIARDIADLANRARAGKLTNEDMEGGTFTINNTGSFGSVQSIGIINYPQAAILQVESIIKRPVVLNDGIAIRDMINLCLSLDHRILDGLICGHFMQRVKEILENIPKENTSVY